MNAPADGTLSALGCLRAVLALAREQAAALETEALDRFDALLDERDVLMARLAESPPSFGDAETRALATAARELIEQDRRNQAALGDLLRQVRAELPILAASSRAASAYRVASEAAAAYVDRAS